MISFPNAKINLGLSIISKRPDGYHNLESCFYPVPWQDILEIIPADKLEFSSTGLEIPGTSEDNLCLKAYHLLKKDFDIPPFHIHLHKVIPMGAGLGGGSSDAAFLLKMINEKCELGLNNEQLEQFAAQLGSDCPFFIENKPVLAIGTGTELSSIDIDLTGKYLILIKPDVHITTADAYAGITPKEPVLSIKDIVENHTPGSWDGILHNDFEDSIFKKHKIIKAVKKKLYEYDALYASMTGSGAAVYGIFKEKVQINVPEDWTVYNCQL